MSAPLLPLADLAPDVRPQDDLWGHVNATWAARDPIPPDRARWGVSDERRAQIAEQLAEIASAADPGSDRAEERLVARLHASALDAVRREQAGAAPLGDELAEVAACAGVPDLLHALGRRQREGVTGLASVSVHPDGADPAAWSVHLFQAGLTLPVPTMYDRLGDALEAAAVELVVRCGLPADVARRGIDLERAIAAASWPRPEGEDDAALTNAVAWDDLDTTLGTAFAPLLAGLGLEHAREAPLNLCQPSYWTGLGRLLRERPLADWQTWLSWQVVAARAPLLHSGARAAHHDFFGRTLRGQQDPAPPWREAVELVQEHLGTALARLWVERHLDPATKRATRRLAEAVRDELRRTIGECGWMAFATRSRAVAKLDRVVLNIGWPDHWPAAPDLDLGPDLVTNVRLTAAHTTDGLSDRLRGPVDRGRWGPPPFAVGCSYHPVLNQVTVAGGSLAPADHAADPAVLHGRYASILGHELGHAFDSRGSQRDATGAVRAWWTRHDRAAFDARVAAVEAQVDGYRPRGLGDDDAGVDGHLVGFETVAELIGYQAAWDAYVTATTEAERATVVDGLTGPQRFFVAKAHGRRAVDRPATTRARLQSDVHPPFELFANLARNLHAFHDAFGTRPGDGMWLDPADRVRVF